MRSPYAWLQFEWQLVLVLVLIALTLAYGHYLQRQGAPVERVLDHGVLDLEAPWSTARAKAVIARLGECEREVARKQVRLDFAFLVLYPLAISLSCALLGDYLGGRAGLVGLMAAWAVLIAGPLDAVENLAILMMLGNDVSAPWPQLSTTCAALKFTLALGGISYVALAGMGALICRLYG